ncbi:hypothetical protein B296_00025115 [Ensete ventricosum]|uniref:DOG1 domain-containing protein n=1 Tax=Ensete ventricosum TaxID=4639 RepID=A0A427AGS8_ENSVE|nr:hypothetical protein B296_00025115 [Ensete ventricosum]
MGATSRRKRLGAKLQCATAVKRNVLSQRCCCRMLPAAPTSHSLSLSPVMARFTGRPDVPRLPRRGGPIGRARQRPYPRREGVAHVPRSRPPPVRRSPAHTKIRPKGALQQAPSGFNIGDAVLDLTRSLMAFSRGQIENWGDSAMVVSSPITDTSTDVEIEDRTKMKKREKKKRRGRKIPAVVRVALPRFLRAICCPCDPSTTGNFFAHPGGRFLLPGIGALAFDLEYARWLEDHQRRINDLRSALNSQVNDDELRLIILVSHLEPLTDQQLMGLCNLQHSSQQAEDALSQGMEALQQSLSETLASASLVPAGGADNVSNYMGQMTIAMGKLSTLENFLRQVFYACLLTINSCFLYVSYMQRSS